MTLRRTTFPTPAPTSEVPRLASLVLLVVGLSALSTACVDDEALDEGLESVEQSVTTSTITCNAAGGLPGGNYTLYSGVVTGSTINSVGAYDVKSICVAEMNKRRRQVHTSYNGLSLNPYHVYHASDNSSIVPSYAAATVAGGLNTTTEGCRAIADAKAGTHSGYGSPLPGATTAFCGATGFTTAGAAIVNCMNMIEKENGFSGHQGGLLWDTARPISCAIGVYNVNGTLKKGVSIGWGTPWLTSGRPNGARCKGNGYCASGVCGSDSRCKGATNTACPAAQSLDCTQHTEDPGLCLQRGIACQSGVCRSDNKCQ